MHFINSLGVLNLGQIWTNPILSLEEIAPKPNRNAWTSQGLLKATSHLDTWSCLSQQVDSQKGNAELWLIKSPQGYLSRHQDISPILAGYKRAPYVAWGTICTPRKHGGLGVKNLNLWNIACRSKEKGSLMGPMDSWEVPKTEGLVGVHPKEKGSKHTPKETTGERKDLWTLLRAEWSLKLQLDGMKTFITSSIKLKMPKKLRSLIQAMANAVIYHIWLARNRLHFKNQVYPVQGVLKEIKAQITQIVLQIHQHRNKYNTCIDFLLHRK
ncbi:hypothetical protein Cgig2_029105 [Carnegiea gigantea]|uniref:Uncharacterized protein n=1 Tax=Carnegiea gigantea TaxID=171969 RepID=A0A9Q1GMZ1_9CARY|nr:hypothetical protein Cgig2_029105 [Carnegiea gigantea]